MSSVAPTIDTLIKHRTQKESASVCPSKGYKANKLFTCGNPTPRQPCSHDWVLHLPQTSRSPPLVRRSHRAKNRSGNILLCFNSRHPQPGSPCAHKLLMHHCSPHAVWPRVLNEAVDVHRLGFLDANAEAGGKRSASRAGSASALCMCCSCRSLIVQGWRNLGR